MRIQDKTPLGGGASNVFYLQRDSLKSNTFPQSRQALKLPDPKRNSLLLWERAAIYRRVNEDSPSLDGLIAYENAMALFNSVFREDCHD